MYRQLMSMSTFVARGKHFNSLINTPDHLSSFKSQTLCDTMINISVDTFSEVLADNFIACLSRLLRYQSTKVQNTAIVTLDKTTETVIIFCPDSQIRV